MMLGNAYFGNRDFEAARGVYQQILALEIPVLLWKYHETACDRLLEIEFNELPGDYRSLVKYESALGRNPTNPSLNRLVARFYVKESCRSPQAMQVLERALEVEPGNSALRLACAEA